MARETFIAVTSAFEPAGDPAGRGARHQLRPVRPARGVRAAGPRARGRADPGVPVLVAGRAGARQLPLGRGGRPARPADRRRGALDHAVLEPRRGGPAQPTDFQPPSPALDQRAYAEFVRQVVRRCRGAGPLLAVRQRAEQHRPALGGHRGRVRRAAEDHLRRGQGGRPGRGGRPRRLRLRRVQQRAGQRAAAVLRPRAKAGRDAFDLFSVHLYGDLDRVPDTWPRPGSSCGRTGTSSRGRGEHAGPQPFEFPEVMAVMQETFAAAFAEAAAAARRAPASSPNGPGRTPPNAGR